MHQRAISSARRGGAKPALIAGIILALAAVAAGAWYFMKDEDASTGDLKVMVDGKEVDPKQFMKDNKIELKGGPAINLANPHEHMSKLVGDYFKLRAGAQRLKYLDDMIDQQEKARKELQITTGPDGMPQVKVSGNSTTKPGDGPTKKSMVVMRSNSGAAQDSMPPELRAQMAEYLKAINDRRAARGLAPQQGLMMIRKSS